MQIVDRTPEERDRYVDFLRVASIAVVVLGHWLMAVVTWSGGGIGGYNALERIDGGWLLTWLFQVMPLFFFVGGFGNLKKWWSLRRRGAGYADYLRGRLARLMRPTAVFIGVGISLVLILERFTALDIGELGVATKLIAQPLWFLVVYFLVVGLTPAMAALHDRRPLATVSGLALAAGLIDVARLAFGVPHIGWLNFAVVWLFVHQLGFFYADGTFVHLRRRALGAIAGVGAGMLVVLTNIGVYSRSMVGIGDGLVSNNTPPSVCICFLALWMIGAVMLGRGPVTRWLESRRMWAATIAINSIVMTIYLWHLSALAMGVLLFYPLGWPQLEAGTAQWWALRPLWLCLLAVCLIPFVGVFARFERVRAPSSVSSIEAQLRLEAEELG